MGAPCAAAGTGAAGSAALKRSVAALALFATLALASTWPLGVRLGAVVPLGTDPDATVTLASSWALWWTADRLAAGLRGYWDAPIFFPTPDAFAFSEPMPLVGAAAAPVLWAGGSAALAHGLVVLAALALNGWLAFGLCRALRLRALACAGGGAMVVLLPFVHHELGVLTLVPLAGVLAALRALLRLARAPSLRRGLAVGIALGATFLVCGQNLVFLGLSGLPAAAWLWRGGPAWTRRLGPSLALAAVAAAVLVAPVALAQRRALAAHGFARSEARAAEGAASTASWLRVPWRPAVPLPLVDEASEPHRRALFPGAVKLALAFAGAAWGWRRAGRRRATAFLVTLGLAAAVLASLPGVQLGAFEPYEWLRALPGVSQIRSVFRAAVLTQLAVALLAAEGVHGLMARADAWARRRSVRVPSPSVRGAAAAALALLATAELWPTRQGFASVPTRAELAPLLAWIERDTGPREPLLYLPFPAGPTPHDFEDTARWMYATTFHGRPMVNGYSSFFPVVYSGVGKAVAGFPDRRSHAAVRWIHGRFVVARRSWLRGANLAPDEPAWHLVLDLPAEDISVWEAREAPPGTP